MNHHIWFTVAFPARCIAANFPYFSEDGCHILIIKTNEFLFAVKAHTHTHTSLKREEKHGLRTILISGIHTIHRGWHRWKKFCFNQFHEDFFTVTTKPSLWTCVICMCEHVEVVLLWHTSLSGFSILFVRPGASRNLDLTLLSWQVRPQKSLSLGFDLGVAGLFSLPWSSTHTEGLNSSTYAWMTNIASTDTSPQLLQNI